MLKSLKTLKQKPYARWGGEGFVVMLQGTGIEGAYNVLERIRRIIESYDFELEVETKVTFSTGLVAYQAVKEDHKEEKSLPEHLLELADQALYQAKDQEKYDHKSSRME